MNRRDRLKKIVLAAFDKNTITSEAVRQCNEAIQYVINEIVEAEAYNELKLRGLSEDKLPELIDKISQRYSIKTIEYRRLLKMVAIKAYIDWGKRLMKRVKVPIPIVILICSLLVTGCSSTEINAKEEATIKEDVTYKIVWSEKGEDHALEFSPYNHVTYRASVGNKTIFYFDDNSEFESIIVQSGICTILNRDMSSMIISGDFVIEPVEGE